MTRNDLLYMLNFIDELEAVIDADDVGVSWDLADLAANAKTIIITALGESEQ